ncbi:MAG TPA: hypothetical protein VGD17_07725 [Chitinophagaceae bacterium]
MKKFFCILLILAGFIKISPAQKASAIPMPDVKRLMSMSPAEREKYADSLKKASSGEIIKLAGQYGLSIDETVLPGVEIKPPVKDEARLALIPSRPPTRTELITQVQKSQQQLQSVVPKADVAEIQKFSAAESTATLHQASIGKFYSNDLAKALLLMMQVAQKEPDSLVVWNNLAAMYNQAGMQHRAIPMLRYCLQQDPSSSMVLNNLGQSFYGLGDLIKARLYFLESLALDSLNPEANHAMGMLHMFEKKYDDAMRYFERELTVAFRNSTLAYAAKMGKKFNLRALAKRRNQLNGRPEKDFFEEINLGKFSIPDFPSNIEEAYAQVPEYITFGSSVQLESQFWLTTGMPTMEEIEADGKRKPGMYSSLVKALLDELHEEFSPDYLSNIRDEDARIGLDIINFYSKELQKVKCPQPPAGSSLEAQAAYEFKCCKQLQQPIINKRIAEYSGFWAPKFRVAQQRWKSYINQLIAIVQLDPSLSNKMMVNKTVGGYFTFLATALLFSATGEAVSQTLPTCDIKLDLEKADSVITADRNWNLQCPKWLNIEVDVEVAKIKADCSKYGIEVGSSVIGQYEYEFKTGRSTLAAGMGVKAKFFAGIGKASMKQLAFITFDNNGEIADFGSRTKAEVGIGDTPIKIGPTKVGGTIIGIEGNFQIGIIGGMTSNVKGKGVIADFVNIDRSL